MSENYKYELFQESVTSANQPGIDGKIEKPFEEPDKSFEATQEYVENEVNEETPKNNSIRP